MVVECHQVAKTFRVNKKRITALHPTDLNIAEGEFLVIGGENGSGKSTLLKLMVGLLLPDSGEITVLGLPVAREWKKLAYRIGLVLPSDRSLYWKLTARENLIVHGGIYRLSPTQVRQRIPALLEQMGLAAQQNQLVEGFSTGMRRKLMLAKALLHQPRLILADEVLGGLDAQATAEIVKQLVVLNQQEGVTVVLVSHVLHDLPADARLVLMKEGRIVLDGPLRQFSFAGFLRLSAQINQATVEELVEENQVAERIRQWTEQGAMDIHVERDDVYALVRRHLR
ncbi:MAG: ABC transporter ATP-binding protein [bacterium]